ncbi:MAG: ABC transporter ATP-binding protein [Acetobacteraceae bacterium]
MIELRNLTVSFGSLPVVRGLDLAIFPGEALGIVGESGSGKSVTWLAVLALLPGSARLSGQALLAGQDLIGATEAELARIRGGQIALIFQDPASALNPVKRVGSQVVEAIRLHRHLRGSAAREAARRLFEQVGMPDPAQRLDLYPHELSGGQSQRVMIAMALAGHPRLLIADEPTTALDVTIEAQILALLERLRRETGMAVVLISHDLSVVGEVCDRIAVMYAGQIVEIAASSEIFANPAHPYTRGLLAAAPPIRGRRERLIPIPGQVPEPWNIPPGCAFQPRCPYAIADCGLAPPPLLAVADEHHSRCIRARVLPPYLNRAPPAPRGQGPGAPA